MKPLFKLSLCLLLFICTTTTLKAQETEVNLDNNFTHVVYFWLHNPNSEEDRAAFLQSLSKFMDSSLYAKTKFIGTPAGTPREVVDGSFTFSLILSFPSKEVQDLYQKEAAHLQFIEESEHLWKRVLVYDSVGISNDN